MFDLLIPLSMRIRDGGIVPSAVSQALRVSYSGVPSRPRESQRPVGLPPQSQEVTHVTALRGMGFRCMPFRFSPHHFLNTTKNDIICVLPARALSGYLAPRGTGAR